MIEQRLHELGHRVEGALLRAGGGFARGLRERGVEPGAGQPEQGAEAGGYAASGDQRRIDPRRDASLVGVGAGQRKRQQRWIERQQHIAADIAQLRVVGEIVAADNGSGLKCSCQGRGSQDDIGRGRQHTAERLNRHGPGQRRRAGDVGVGADDAGAGNLHHIGRRRGEGEAALHPQCTDRVIPRRKRAAVDGGVADGAGAAEGSPGVDGGQRRRRDRAVHGQRTAVHRGAPRVAVDAGERLRAAGERQPAAALDDAGIAGRGIRQR
jgi:hypothetical protein